MKDFTNKCTISRSGLSRRLATLFLFLAALFTTAFGQDETIRIDTNLVRVPASVIDRNGRSVPDLSVGDFQIFEDDVEQEIAVFESVEEPFTVLFLLDVSGSMSNELPKLTEVANKFVSKLRPADKLAAAVFADRVKFLFEPTEVKELRKGIVLRPFYDSRYTLLYDAVDTGLKRSRKISGRKAIVVFSDGAGAGASGNMGIATAKSNLRDAEESEAIIYTVQFDTFSQEPPRYVSKDVYRKRIEEIDVFMRDLAVKSGGRNFKVNEISNLAEVFGTIADELGRQYVLGYYPKQSSNARRQIRVKLKRPELVVRARQSYIPTSGKSKN